MSYEKPVVRDYGDVAEMTAASVGVDISCSTADACVSGVKVGDVTVGG